MAGGKTSASTGKPQPRKASKPSSSAASTGSNAASKPAPPPLVVSLGLAKQTPPAVLVMLGGWAVTLAATVLFNDSVDARLGIATGKVEEWYSPTVGYFLLAYLLAILGLRLWEDGSHIMYEMMWACNVGMLVASVGMITGRPRMVSGSITMVGLDQLVWYIDVICYLVLGKFKFGVADYLLWPNTSKIKKITCTHHLWFIPLCMWYLGGSLPEWTFRQGAFVVTFITVFARIFTPFDMPLKDGSRLYMNINSSYKFWKDVKIGFLHMFDDSPFYLIALIIFGNLCLNGPPYLLCKAIMALV